MYPKSRYLPKLTLDSVSGVVRNLIAEDLSLKFVTQPKSLFFNLEVISQSEYNGWKILIHIGIDEFIFCQKYGFIKPGDLMTFKQKSYKVTVMNNKIVLLTNFAIKQDSLWITSKYLNLPHYGVKIIDGKPTIIDRTDADALKLVSMYKTYNDAINYNKYYNKNVVWLKICDLSMKISQNRNFNSKKYIKSYRNKRKNEVKDERPTKKLKLKLSKPFLNPTELKFRDKIRDIIRTKIPSKLSTECEVILFEKYGKQHGLKWNKSVEKNVICLKACDDNLYVNKAIDCMKKMGDSMLSMRLHIISIYDIINLNEQEIGVRNTIAAEIENECKTSFSGTYTNKMRDIAFNLNKNATLKKKIINGDMTALLLCHLNYEELACDSMQKKRTNIKNLGLHEKIRKENADPLKRDSYRRKWKQHIVDEEKEYSDCTYR